MGMNNVANLAHEDAAFILTCLDAQELDAIGMARECAAGRKLDVQSAEGRVYVERFAGHIINVQCGTAGR